MNKDYLLTVEQYGVSYQQIYSWVRKYEESLNHYEGFPRFYRKKELTTFMNVGIVQRIENGIVYTVEGNSGNACRERQYSVGYYEILGYGVLVYENQPLLRLVTYLYS